MKMEQSVPKRRHIKFRRRGITQKKTYNSLLNYAAYITFLRRRKLSYIFPVLLAGTVRSRNGGYSIEKTCDSTRRSRSVSVGAQFL